MRGPRAWAAVLATALSLSACSLVPTSGPIEQGPVVDSSEVTQFIRVIAAPPSPGASPQEIVRGFLEANASLEQDHAIARRYLTPEAAQAWRPDASTTVYAQPSLALAGSGPQVRARMDVVGRLEADGSLVTLDPAERRSVEFALEEVPPDGRRSPEWRISDPPEGVLIGDVDLRRAYRDYPVHFMSARSDVLVPDARMIPIVGPSLPTTLAERVLAGPSAQLAPGVRAPELRIGLALGAVPVNDGVAVVDLTEPARAADDGQRRDLAAALTWTLTEVPGVRAVRLRVGGEPFEVPGAPEVMDRASWAAFGPDAQTTGPNGDRRPPRYVLVGGTIVRVSDVGSTSVSVGLAGAETLVGLAVSPDQRRASLVDPRGRSLWVLPLDRTTTQRRVRGRGLGPASFDVDGLAWFPESGGVRRLGADDTVQPIPVRSDRLPPVTRLALARDGARVALVAGGTVHIGVLADVDGRPVIEAVHRVDSSVGDVTDVAWRDSGTVEVLGADASGVRQALRIDVGSGQVVPLGAPPGARDLAAAPNAVTVVATSDEAVFGNVGLQWRDEGRGRSVAYPG